MNTPVHSHSARSFQSIHAFAIPIVWYVIFVLGGAAGMSVPQIKARMGIVDPKAARIVKLQETVAEKDAQIGKAQGEKDAAVNDAKKTIKDATQIAHQEIHGAKTELDKPEPNIETVKVLVNHADESLTRVFGPLSDAQVAEINAIIDARAAGKVAIAEALLAEKDRRVKELMADNAKAEQTITAKTETIKTLEVQKAETVTKLNAVTADVLQKEQTLVAKARELTGWGAYWAQVKFWFWVAVGVYAFVHFLAPSIDDELDKHYPPSGAMPLWVRAFHAIYNLLKTVTCAH